MGRIKKVDKERGLQMLQRSYIDDVWQQPCYNDNEGSLSDSGSEIDENGEKNMPYQFDNELNDDECMVLSPQQGSYIVKNDNNDEVIIDHLQKDITTSEKYSTESERSSAAAASPVSHQLDPLTAKIHDILNKNTVFRKGCIFTTKTASSRMNMSINALDDKYYFISSMLRDKIQQINADINGETLLMHNAATRMIRENVKHFPGHDATFEQVWQGVVDNMRTC